MRYLAENELGFDPTGLGYPGIRGCHAVVYVTSQGLFGLHNFGGADDTSWKDRSDAFGVYVHAHAKGNATGKALYGICFASGKDSRGYGVGDYKSVWRGELTRFAGAVGFSGPIYGYDMAKQNVPPPVYVEAGWVGDTSVVQMKAWNKDDASKDNNLSPADHVLMRRNPNGVGYKLQATSEKVVTSVTRTGLKTVYPEKLR